MRPEHDDFFDPLDGDTAGEPRGSSRVVPEFVRKMAVAGLGALFMTEEGIRNLAGQLKLPKEMLGYLLQQAEKTKDEVGRVASEEIRRFLQSEKLRDEFLRLLSGMTVEIKAEVRLVPPRNGEKDEEEQPPLVVSELKARPSSGGRRKKE